MSSSDIVRFSNSHTFDADSRICRLCLQCTNASMEKISSVADIIKFVTKLTVQDGDELPEYICVSCYLDLLRAQNFINQSIANDRILRARLFAQQQDVYALRNVRVINRASSLLAAEVPISMAAEQTNAHDAQMLFTNKYIDYAPQTDPLCLENVKVDLQTDTHEDPHLTQLIIMPTIKSELSTDPQELPACVTYLQNDSNKESVTNRIEVVAVQAIEDASNNNEFPHAFKTDMNNHLLPSDLDDENKELNYFSSSETLAILDTPKKSAEQAKPLPKHKSKSFQCLTCRKPFAYKKTLVNHTRKHHPVAWKIAQICPKLTNSAHAQITRGQGMVKEPLKFSCNKCGDVFEKETQLLQHMKSHVILALHKCAICGKEYVKIACFFKHVKSHHMEQVLYKCKFCEKEFSRKSSFSGHLRSHLLKESRISLSHKENGTYNCYRCCKEFSDKSTMLSHFCKYICVGRFKCDSCLKSFGKEEALSDHILRTHNKKISKAFDCKRGNISLQSMEMFREPNSIVHVNEEFTKSKINFVDANYVENRKGLNIKLSNVIDESFTCSKCDRRFTDSFGLANHILLDHYKAKAVKAAHKNSTTMLS